MGNYVIIAAAAGIVLFGLFRGVKVFDVFVEGAREGMRSAVGIMPALTAP